MEDTASSPNKRFRDDDEVEESPEEKRLRADLLFDILDDDDTEAGERDPAVQGLDSVMRSLEEEISLPLPLPLPLHPPEEVADLVADLDDLRQPDLGYLLEASDDELGLPPTVPSSSSEEAEVEVIADGGGGGEEVAAGFGQIWGFDDEIQPGCYDGLDYGIRHDNRDAVAGAGGDCDAVADEGLAFEGGLFDYADVLYGTGDFSDSAWRSESLPAL